MGNAILYLEPRLLILSLISLINGAFGLYVLLKNKNSRINRAFFAFIISLVFWAVTILAFFLAPDTQSAKLVMQMAYLSAILIAISFLHFVNLYPFKLFSYHPLSALGLITSTVLVSIIIFAPDYLIHQVTIENGIRDVILNRLGHTVFSFYFLTISLAILYTFLYKYIKSDGINRIRIRTVALGCLTTLALGVFFNLVMPGLGNHSYIWLGPYFTIAITLVVGYTLKLSDQIK